MAGSRAAASCTFRAKLAERQLRGAFRGITSTRPNSNLVVSHATSQLPANLPLSGIEYGSGLQQNNSYQRPGFVPIARAGPPSTSKDSPFTHLLSSITQSLRNDPSANIPELHALLTAYKSNASHWSHYAYADGTKAYTRNLVCELPGIFNLMILVWTPGKASPVHDHADAHCLMKILKGTIRETRYAMPTVKEGRAPLIETSKRNFETGKISYMADALGLHSVSNPHPTEYGVSLHLYTPPNAALKGCHVYNLGNGGARHVLQGPCDSVRGVASVQNGLLGCTPRRGIGTGRAYSGDAA